MAIPFFNEMRIIRAYTQDIGLKRAFLKKVEPIL
jgi:hypothetical protein